MMEKTQDREELKKKYDDAVGMRDKIKQTLEEKPFLKAEVRSQLKISLAAYDHLIKKIKADIIQLEVMASITPEDLERAPTVHYQHHMK